jgi:hypothetical protein
LAVGPQIGALGVSLDFHLEHGLRLDIEPEYKNLYAWAINEIDSHGQQIGRDQIPWPWSLHFTATSCALDDSFEIELEKKVETTASPTPPKIAQKQAIRLQLRPGDSRQNDEGRTTFSMFGTKRTIKDFQLHIYPISDSAERERCWAWGSVSYDFEVDFRYETTNDCIVFYLCVKPETFARYGAKIAHGLVDEIIFRVASVSGFYSEWSPGISTRDVKVLICDHKVNLPPGFQFEPPRLGHVGEAALFVNRILGFRKCAPESETTSEIVDGETEQTIPQMQASAAPGSGGMFGMLDYRAHNLYKLLVYPITFILSIVALFFLPILAYFIAVHFVSGRLIQLAVAAVILFLLGIPWVFAAKMIVAIPVSIFNFLIDPEPTQGRTKEEALLIVQSGKKAITTLKFNKPASEWTDEAIDALSRLTLTSSLFQSDIRRRIYAVRDHYLKHPNLTPNEHNTRKFLKEHKLTIGWMEKVITVPMWRNTTIQYFILLMTFIVATP